MYIYTHTHSLLETHTRVYTHARAVTHAPRAHNEGRPVSRIKCVGVIKRFLLAPDHGVLCVCVSVLVGWLVVVRWISWLVVVCWCARGRGVAI
jgi:hypothetical protein